MIGFQLTHSGRFCRPTDKKKLESRIAFRHPILDRKFGIDPADDSIIKKPAAADSTNATADEARNWGPPTVENTLALERNFSEMKRLGHQTLEETRSH